MSRLGELLVAQRLVTAAQVEEGLETQVVHGGRLGTNLVELGFVAEADLARVLGQQHGLPYASGEMVPDPQALAVAERQFYDDQDVLPMRVDATRLTVAVLHPNQMKALEVLGFRASKRVVAVVIPEFRMNQLLRKYTRAFRPLRPIDVNTLRPPKRESGDGPRPAEVGDLINEGDFAKLYASAMAEAPDTDEVLVGQVVEDDAPRPSAPSPPEVEPAPLTFAEAQRLLQTSGDRHDIARTVLRFARSKFQRALLLGVRGDLVTGWVGMGQGVSARAVQRIGVSLREDNTLTLVRNLRSHFVGPMKPSPGMDVFYAQLGGAYPKTAVVMPLLVRGKPVHLLYVDQGPGALTPPDLGELLIVSQGVTRSYEAMIRARQSAA